MHVYTFLGIEQFNNLMSLEVPVASALLNTAVLDILGAHHILLHVEFNSP